MRIVRCKGCGATVDPLALECAFCRTTTEAGVAAKAHEQHLAYAQAHWQAHAQHQANQAAQARLLTAANHALLWAILGMGLCCFPIGVVGVVMGLRSRMIASSIKAPVPARATVGLVLGIVSIVASVGFWSWTIVSTEISEKKAKERIAWIERDLGDRAEANVLEHDVACSIAELYVLEHGYDDVRKYSVEKVECFGKLTQLSPEQMELQDFRFSSSSKKVEVSVCFKRGARWYVSDVKPGSCRQLDAAATTNASQAPSASSPPKRTTPTAPSAPSRPVKPAK